MRLFYWIFAGVLAAAAGLFALGNRGDVTIDFWPVGPAFEMPLFLALVGALYIGFALGALIAWFAGGRARSRARAATKRADALARDVADLKAKLAKSAPAAASPPTSPGSPASLPIPAPPV
jgi:lipopolysaccharide assembly protein A